LGTLFISNGKQSMPARVEIRLALAEPDETVWETTPAKK
jgi:hypothetical protein